MSERPSVFIVWEGDEYRKIMGVFAKKEDAEAILAATDPRYDFWMEEELLLQETLTLNNYWLKTKTVYRPNSGEPQEEFFAEVTSPFPIKEVARKEFMRTVASAASKERVEELWGKL